LCSSPALSPRRPGLFSSSRSRAATGAAAAPPLRLHHRDAPGGV